MQSQISLFFDENFGLQSLRFKFWRLPPVSNEFFVLKNIFFCLDIWRFLFTLLCGVSKGLMKTLRAFKKPFEASQRRVKRCYCGQDLMWKRMVRLRFLTCSFQVLEIQLEFHCSFTYQHLWFYLYTFGFLRLFVTNLI